MQGPRPERGLRRAAGTSSVESQRKEKVFQRRRGRDIGLVLAPTPSFFLRESKFGRDTCPSPRLLREAGAGGARASEAACCGPQARRVASLGGRARRGQATSTGLPRGSPEAAHGNVLCQLESRPNGSGQRRNWDQSPGLRPRPGPAPARAGGRRPRTGHATRGTEVSHASRLGPATTSSVSGFWDPLPAEGPAQGRPPDPMRLRRRRLCSQRPCPALSPITTPGGRTQGVTNVAAGGASARVPVTGQHGQAQGAQVWESDGAGPGPTVSLSRCGPLGNSVTLGFPICQAGMTITLQRVCHEAQTRRHCDCAL